MSDLLAESTISFAAAARSLPACRAGRPVNPSTLWRGSRAASADLEASAYILKR